MLSQSEVAEQKLAHQVRTNNVRQQAQEMLEKFKASSDTASGSLSPAAGVNLFTASGDLQNRRSQHSVINGRFTGVITDSGDLRVSVINPPHSAAS